MEKSLINHVTDFFLNNFAWMIYKSFVEGEDKVTKEFITENMANPLVLNAEPGIKTDMLNVQLNEARDEGYVESVDLGFNNEESFVSSGKMIFILTDKGREFMFEEVKKSLTEHFSAVATKISELE